MRSYALVLALAFGAAQVAEGAAPPVLRAGRTKKPGKKKKKGDKEPEKKAAPPEEDPPKEAPAAGGCPDGKPTAEEVDQFVAGDAGAAGKVKGYAAKCKGYGGQLGKELYLRGYGLKDDRPEEAAKVLEKCLEVAPGSSDTADKAQALLVKVRRVRD